MDVENKTYDSRSNCNAIIETKTNTLITGCKKTDIPNSVTSIGYSTFRHCISLTSITIPNSVTSIGDYAFDGCSKLTTVTISNSVTDIGDRLFRDCCRLTSITIPNSVTRIVGYAFLGCSKLASVTIGNSVSNIGAWAISECSSLADIHCLAETVPETSSSAFDKSNIENATLHVPAASVNDYSNTAPWTGFKKIVPLTD